MPWYHLHLGRGLLLIMLMCQPQSALGIRLPLTDSYMPYFGVGTQGDVLQWAGARTMYAVQQALVIEVSPRGLRFVFRNNKQQKQIYQLKNDLHSIGIAKDLTCAPQPGAMCCMKEGCFMPSPPSANLNYEDTSSSSRRLQQPSFPGQFPVMVVSSNNMERLGSDLLKAYAEASFEACSRKENGVGRIYENDHNSTGGEYTVSACDVLQGHFVAMYYPVQDKLLLFRQTFGPMAYTAVLLVSIIIIIILFLYHHHHDHHY